MEYKDEIFIVGGDFNVAPYQHDTYIADYNGIMASLEERRLINELRKVGYIDALAEKGFTWWDYRRSGFQKDNGFRLDQFYLSPKTSTSFANGEVIRYARGLQRPSDHAPIECEIKI